MHRHAQVLIGLDVVDVEVGIGLEIVPSEQSVVSGHDRSAHDRIDLRICNAWSWVRSARGPVVELGSGTGMIALDRSLNYLIVIWPALVFGILIGRAILRPAGMAGSRFLRARDSRTLKAAMAGAPLMLCSCCVAPVFRAAYERTLRMMLASPLLNPPKRRKFYLPSAACSLIARICVYASLADWSP